MQAKTNLQSSPGMLPYSPTRLDWLELDLQANYREADDSDPEKYHTLDFVAKPPDTIVVFVQYSNQTSAKTVDKMVEHGRSLAERVITCYGWSSWAEIEVQKKLTPNR